MKRRLLAACVAALALAAPAVSEAQTRRAPAGAAVSAATPAASAGFTGVWRIDKARSTAIDPWYDLTVRLYVDRAAVRLVRHWRGSQEGGTAVDSVRLVPGGAAARARPPQWPDNRHLGAFLTGDSTKTVVGRWADGGRTLVTEATLRLEVHQGTTPVRIYTEYRLSPNGQRLDVLELRSTRPTPLHYAFTRAPR